MTDIVEKLRAWKLPDYPELAADIDEAADEIEKLQLESHNRLSRLNAANKRIRELMGVH